MKKLLAAAVLSLLAVGLNTGSASAWFFCHRCCRSCTKICITPYNAFSPVCCGSLCCDGCMPFGGCGPQGCGQGMPSGCCDAGPDYGGSCGLGCLPAPGALLNAPPATAGGPVPNFQAPPPNPLPGGAATSQAWPRQMPFNPVQSAGYQQNYNYGQMQAYPGYNYGQVPAYPGYNYGQVPMYPGYNYGPMGGR